MILTLVLSLHILFVLNTFSSYAMVTPLRKAASYEQRKTNLGSSP